MPSPMNVYREAVRAVPSVKYAMGVAGVVAAGIIAYNLAHEDPKKAILAFVFGLAGMYLLLVFASVRKDSVVVRGPVTLTIWGLTAMFLATLALTLSAYAFGLPEPWARLVGAIPADARVGPSTTTVVTAGETPAATFPVTPTLEAAPPAPGPSPSPPPTETPAPTPTPPPVRETFSVSASSDDCGANLEMVREVCTTSGRAIESWEGPTVTSANCGSVVLSASVNSGRPSCLSIRMHVQGCGYDEFPFGIRNCRGRGWIGADYVIVSR